MAGRGFRRQLDQGIDSVDRNLGDVSINSQKYGAGFRDQAGSAKTSMI